MKGVIVQWINHVQCPVWGVDIDHWVVDRIRHCDIEGPIPVWYTKGDGCCLIYAALACWVGGGDLLGIAPEDLLR